MENYWRPRLVIPRFPPTPLGEHHALSVIYGSLLFYAELVRVLAEGLHAVSAFILNPHIIGTRSSDNRLLYSTTFVQPIVRFYPHTVNILKPLVRLSIDCELI